MQPTPNAAVLTRSTPEIHPVMAFLDRSILRERRMEALWKRAAKGNFGEETQERFLFEAYEDREHARILRRHRRTVAKSLGGNVRAPGSRATKVGRTVTPEAALAEALALKIQARTDYNNMFEAVQDRFLRKFVQVLGGAEDEALVELLERSREIGVRPVAPKRRHVMPAVALNPPTLTRVPASPSAAHAAAV
ncbi:MAG: hypothetical protein ACYTDX_01270 [Planctomycetota bacterium]|jgi:hypothetical protein